MTITSKATVLRTVLNHRALGHSENAAAEHAAERYAIPVEIVRGVVDEHSLVADADGSVIEHKCEHCGECRCGGRA